ncbi:MAG: hypothetical protein WCX82_03410 [archaeon]|jgi:hypothetical protein
MSWEIAERPGYLGKKRDEIHSFWDKQYGKDNWKLAYQWGDRIISREMAIQIYEDAYYEYFKNNSLFLEWLVKRASDIFDTDESNLKSDLDYNNQETSNNHIHDISIKRAILRLGKKFLGDHVVQVRWVDSEGFLINPGVVPFHKPELILKEEIKDYGEKGIWWKENTIEDFYQRNKVLLMRKI